MDLAKRREELTVMTPEVTEDRLVGVETEELSDDLDGYDLRIGELRGGATLAKGSPVFEPVVHQAEDGYDEGALRSKRRPPLRPVPLSQHRA
jgi:hypothetical protein